MESFILLFMLESKPTHYPLFILFFPVDLFYFIASLHPVVHTPTPFQIYRLCLFAYRFWFVLFFASVFVIMRFY